MSGLGVLQISAAMAVWSSWGLFARWLTLAPWVISFWVAAVSCGVSGGLWLARGGRPGALWPRGQRALLTALGVVFLVNSVAYLAAMQWTTVANAVFTHYTAPVLVAVLAPLVLKERLRPSTPAALALSVAGMALLLPWDGGALGGRHLQGIGAGLLSGVAYALLVLLAKHLSPRVPTLVLLFAQNLVIAVLLLPFAVGAGVPEPGDAAALGVLGTVHATLAGFWYLRGLGRVTAQAAAVLGYLEPLAAVALAAWVLGERPSAFALAGGALILAAGGLVVEAEARLRKPLTV